MQTEEKKDPRGGSRPGAGRPKGARDSKPRRPPSVTRQVTMSAEAWALVDTVLATTGQSRMDFFEHLIRTHLR